MSSADILAEYRLFQRGPWSDIQGHLEFLHRAVARRPKAVVIELGVRGGVSTRAFLAGAHESRGQVWSCDIAPPQVPDAIRSSDRWHFIQADDLSQEARDFLPEKCDVLFNDAHDDNWTPGELRDHVLESLRAYAPRVRPGGIIALHDTQWIPRGNVILDKPEGGVAQAIIAYCEETGLSWRNRPWFSGLGVIRIPA